MEESNEKCLTCGSLFADEESYCEECCSHETVEVPYEEDGDFWIEVTCKKCGFWEVKQDNEKYI